MSAFPEIDIRVATECLDVAPLMDTVMVATDPRTGELRCWGEWQMAGKDEPNNVGGIKGDQALLTAIALALFTDRYSTSPRLRAGPDPRGWWGDGLDQQGQPPLGSGIWVYFNGVLTNQVAQEVRAATLEALQPLLVKKGGPVARFDVVTFADTANGRLDVQISG